jgi:hypothetical protein
VAVASACRYDLVDEGAIGRGEEIERRSFRDLPRENSRRSEAVSHLRAGALLEQSTHFFERVGQVRSRRDRQRANGRPGLAVGRTCERHRHRQGDDTWHGGPTHAGRLAWLKQKAMQLHQNAPQKRAGERPFPLGGVEELRCATSRDLRRARRADVGHRLRATFDASAPPA